MALPRQSQEPGSPTPFGKYELFELLGRGGMAEVFLARASGPLGFERILVIKRILAHLSEDDDFREMFVAEAKLSAALAHGNVVQVYEFGEVDGQLFLAMEYVPGTDLRTVLKKISLEGAGIPPGVAAHIAIEVLAGLGHAHAKADLAGSPLQIIHRDVSPSNVLLSSQGEVKICDFGIAKMAARHTSTGRLKGKFAYMSPEQAAGEPVDARSDLFGVGIVLWESLTGKRLFKGDSDVSTLGMVRTAEIPELPDLGAPCQDRLKRILKRALEKKPARRYSSAEIFAADLREWIGMARVREPATALGDLVRQVIAGEDATRQKSIVTETTPDRSGVVDAAQTAVTPRPEMDEHPAPARAPTPAPVVSEAPASAPPPPIAASPAPALAFADSSEVSAASLELVGRRRRPALLVAVGGAALVALALGALLLWSSEPAPEQPANVQPDLHVLPQSPPGHDGLVPPARSASAEPSPPPLPTSPPAPTTSPPDQAAPTSAPMVATELADHPAAPTARTTAREPAVTGTSQNPQAGGASRSTPTTTPPASPTGQPAISAGAQPTTKTPARPRARPSTVNGTVDPFSNLSGGSP